PPAEISFYIHDLVLIDAQLHKGGIVADVGILSFTRIKGQGPEPERFGPLVEPEARTIEVLRWKFAGGWIERIALLLAGEGGGTDSRAQTHQAIEILSLWPK